jgi:murein DD-endopeptidase MepM/ murein hydrolase activator NlpD
MATVCVAALLVVMPSHAAVTSDSMVPFAGTAQVGCTKNSSGSICGGNYHPYDAIDFLVPNGTPVLAPVDGFVRSHHNGCANVRMDTCGSGLGNWVRIAGNDGRDYLMGHLSNVEVTSGSVRQGSRIGASGTSGYSTTPHIHYEERTPASALSGGRLGIGSMDSCTSALAKVTYPGALGYAGWPSVPAHAGRYVTNTNNCWSAATRPAAVTDVRALVHGSRVNLRWAATPGAADYQVFRDGVLKATVTAPTYLDIAVSPKQFHTYAFVARNGAGSSTPTTLYVQTSFESADLAYLSTKDGPAVCGRAGDQSRQMLVCTVRKSTGWVTVHSAANDWGYATDRSWLTNVDGTVSYCRRVGTGAQALCDRFDGVRWSSSMSPSTDLGYADTF